MAFRSSIHDAITAAGKSSESPQFDQRHCNHEVVSQDEKVNHEPSPREKPLWLPLTAYFMLSPFLTGNEIFLVKVSSMVTMTSSSALSPSLTSLEPPLPALLPALEPLPVLMTALALTISMPLSLADELALLEIDLTV